MKGTIKMRKTSLLKSFFSIFLVSALCLFTNTIFAQDDDEDYGSDDEEMSDDLGGGSGDVDSDGADSGMPAPKTEKDWLDKILSECKDKNSPFEPFDAKKDPFKAIVEKKVVAPPVRPTVVRTPSPNERRPAPPPVKPISIFVSGIVGNEGQRLAIIKFENDELTVAKDQIVDGKFKVVDIQADRVTVYSNKEQRRHTFKIGGEKDS